MKPARLAAALLLAALLAQCVLSMRGQNASYDEHSHLPAGYTYWKTGDFRLNPQHPPLVKLLAALPLVLLDPHVRWTHKSWAGDTPDEWDFGGRLLYAWGNDADRLVFWGRVPIVLLSLLLGVYVFRWSAERFGPRAGVFGLVLYAFCPNIIAHSRFVTMDVALSTFLTMTFYYLWRYRRDGTRRALWMCATSLGLALASKFSAVLLAPVVVAWVAWPRAVAPPSGPAAGTKRSKKKKDAAAVARPAPSGALAAIVVIGGSAAIVWGSYFFSDPGAYFRGLAAVRGDHHPDHYFYLMGHFKQGGWWYYFLTACLFKAPVPAMLAIAAAGVIAWRERASQAHADAFLLAPAVLFFVLTSALAPNLGVRYVLPVFPLFFVFASRIGEMLTRSRAGLAFITVLAVWQVAGTLRVHPDYIAYFNEPSGGPARGYRLLDDSNLDWGQDLKRLGEYLKERQITDVRLCYNSQGHPPYYGISARRILTPQLAQAPEPGFYAIAVSCLLRVRGSNEPGKPDLDWLARYEPVGRVGYSFYLFRF